VAIDRDSRRFKLDKLYKDQLTSYREKMDIADFDLKTFLEVKIKEGEISADADLRNVAIAKHLCGGATDLALTSISL
jgi:tRNA:m4X modification enzyme